ncbi:MAG: DUF2953 domain-containing protein [Clostridium sp.]
MIVLLLVFLLLFLLFMPIPLKLSIKYLDDFYEIKFYKINLLSSDGGIIKKFIKDDTVKKYDTSHNIKEEVEEKAQEKIRGTKISMRLLFTNLSNNRYKPYFKVNSNIDFSVNDAAGTAILYGLLNSLNPIIFKILSTFFKIKNFDNKFNPIFKDKYIINISIICILTINIAKIIYMLFLIKKSSIPIRGGAH